MTRNLSFIKKYFVVPDHNQTIRQGTAANAGGIQKSFQKNKCLFRYSRSISNIIQQIINHNKTFASARKRVIAQLRASQRENLMRAA